MNSLPDVDAKTPGFLTRSDKVEGRSEKVLTPSDNIVGKTNNHCRLRDNFLGQSENFLTLRENTNSAIEIAQCCTAKITRGCDIPLFLGEGLRERLLWSVLYSGLVIL